tara:strand:- start:543 stop:713 length:171 start_codon:yes stop_codon:yes gene_type:complete
MTENELEVAMEGIFLGAKRVRAHKYSSMKTSRNLHKHFSSDIATDLWNEEKKNLAA